MARFFGTMVVLIVQMLCMEAIVFSWCREHSSLHCLPIERLALLKFKQGLADPSNRLSSWVAKDCCIWKGIHCDNRTGHVIKLDLRNPYPFDEDPFKSAGLVGNEVNPSLLGLKHLNYLDLSWNNFSGIKIPMFFGSLHELRYLNLSSAWFSGVVPHHLGNLSLLRSLDLSTHSSLKTQGIINYYPISDFKLSIDSMHWISHISSLQHLDLSRVNLSNKASNDDWLQVINLLPSLLELRLSNCGLENIPPISTLSSSFFNLTSLFILDLSSNDFHCPLLPNTFQNMTSLKVLDLSFNGFQGPVPNALRNMTSLRVLDLANNNFNSNDPILDALRNLCNLKVLDLSFNQFKGKPIKNFQRNLSSSCITHNLESLDLSYNQFDGKLLDWLGQFKNLKYLYLATNSFYGAIPTSLGRLSNLSELHLFSTQLNGSIPTSLGELSALKTLLLFSNQLNGPIPTSLGRLSSLRVLDLHSNQFNGNLPESLGQLSELVQLDLSNNSLKGIIYEVHFDKLSKLKYLDIRSNSLVLKVRPDWLPPFQLKFIYMSSCKIGLPFPRWLRTQMMLTSLYISNTSISDSIPNWFGNMSSHLSDLDLSYNQIHGKVPNFLTSSNVDEMYLYLSYNKFEGPLPYFPSNLYVLDLSNNSISEPISQNISDMMPALSVLILSGNLINGSIPISLCKMKSLLVLDVSKNHLSGDLPQCWSNLQVLEVIDLSSNNLSGNIPRSMGYLHSLRSLHLNNNNFSGKLPPALQDCTNLTILDLGENRLSGNIPMWIGNGLSLLRILRLRSNMFDGKIPSPLCHLTSLQIMDLANNKLFGIIPPCFGNFSVMVSSQTIGAEYFDDSYEDQLMEVMKGRELEYREILSLVINMDLSNNNLFGEIPEELTNLSGLHGLNLSINHLTGSIPEKIGQMRSLESLDFSRNQLSGPIPQSMSALTFLSHLNLSYNNLSGRIPSGYQLQTLNDTSVYKGNPKLCGSPLEKKCPGDEPSQGPTYVSGKGKEEGNKSKVDWFYIGMASGFVVGFWGVCGVLLMKTTWRHAYFRFVEDLNDQLSVAIAVRVIRLKKKFYCNQIA